MNNIEILETNTFCPHLDPNKIVFMLHGYGDNAENFIYIAKELQDNESKVNFFALNAPTAIPNYPSGRQWFNLYPNGIYISDAGQNEISIIKSEIIISVKKIINTIKKIKDQFALHYSDCFILGFSQGGIMTFELGNYLQSKLAGLAIISGRILESDKIVNSFFLNTPTFISHGDEDDVLSVTNFYSSLEILKKNKFNYEDHLIKGDSHTISPKAIDLLQKFIKKNL